MECQNTVSGIDLNEIEDEFKSKLPVYSKLCQEALYIIESGLGKTNIKIHEISARVKKCNSFLAKVKGKELKEPFKDIQDIVGIRIVCLFLSDIPKICAIIENNFDLLSEDNKIENTDVSTFGYMSNHLIVSIKKKYHGARYENIVGVPFEIQVRTISQHSWATISHYIDYKTKTAIPKELRKDFHALSGLFHVADTHFEMFYKESKKSSEKKSEEFKKDSPNLDQDINLDSLQAYLKMKFPDRNQLEQKYVSKLIDDLSVFGYKKIQQIDDIIEMAWKAFLAYEMNTLDAGHKFAAVGAVRSVLLLVNKKYAEFLRVEPMIAKYRKLL